MDTQDEQTARASWASIAIVGLVFIGEHARGQKKLK